MTENVTDFILQNNILRSKIRKAKDTGNWQLIGISDMGYLYKSPQMSNISKK